MNAMTATLLTFTAAVCFGGMIVFLAMTAYQALHIGKLAVAASTMVSMRRLEMRQLALRESMFFRLALPWIHAASLAVEKLDPEALRQYVRAPYARAGYPGGLEDDEVVALGFLLSLGAALILGFLATVFVGAMWCWVGVVGLPVGFLLLVSSLKSRGDAREIQILQAMPYMLDLMVLMLRAGTSLRIALGRVVDDYSEHPIGVELGQVLAEIDMGSTRSEAFRRFADRLKIPDINALADSIVQSEELGWPLAETLERLADRLSSERVLKAQATAGAAGVWVMLPATLVLLAGVLLLFSPLILMYLNGSSFIE